MNDYKAACEQIFRLNNKLVNMAEENAQLRAQLEEIEKGMGYWLKQELLDKIEKLQMQVARLEKALQMACEDITDDDCPYENGMCEWAECDGCFHDHELHVNTDRDINCYKRYYLQKDAALDNPGEGEGKE